MLAYRHITHNIEHRAHDKASNEKWKEKSYCKLGKIQISNPKMQPQAT